MNNLFESRSSYEVKLPFRKTNDILHEKNLLKLYSNSKKLYICLDKI